MTGHRQALSYLAFARQEKQSQRPLQQQYTQIHRGIVSTTRSPAALADAARESTGRTEELGSLVHEAAAACAGDAAELTALQTWASSLSR